MKVQSLSAKGAKREEKNDDQVVLCQVVSSCYPQKRLSIRLFPAGQYTLQNMPELAMVHLQPLSESTNTEPQKGRGPLYTHTVTPPHTHSTVQIRISQRETRKDVAILVTPQNRLCCVERKACLIDPRTSHIHHFCSSHDSKWS